MSVETYIAPRHGWVCFHCGEHFQNTDKGVEDAQLHFGTTPDAKPGCLLRMQHNERALLKHIRFLEDELATLRHKVCDEDTDLEREMHSMQTAYAQALRREEEKGYARGLEDAKKYGTQS